MIWIIAIVAVIGIGTGVLAMRIHVQVSGRKEVMAANLQALQSGLEDRRQLLRELAEICRGMVSAEVCDRARDDLASEEEGLRAEKGRFTIAQAELEAVDIRLRELEEIEKELESSGLEASKELEMMRSQERELQQRNDRLRQQLDSALLQFDKLIHDLASSHEAVTRLTAAKNELIETQKKIQYYEQEISMINRKYMDLKRAYDALDIEYAQLYEKHSQG